MKRAIFSSIVAVLVVCTPASGLPGLGSLRSSAAHSPAYPARGQTVTFTVTASDADGMVAGVVLCFGDGNCHGEGDDPTPNERVAACVFGTSYTARFSHTYTRAGVFGVTLTVDTVGCPWNGTERQVSGYQIHVG